MDDGDNATVICEGAGVEGVMGEEVPDLAVYQARYHGAVQADDLRHGLVLCLTAVHDVHVYRGVRSYSRHPDG